MLNMILLFIGTTEIIVIGVIALLLFGGKKLPELMRGLGKGVKEFKAEMNDVKAETDKNHDEASSNEHADETPEAQKEPDTKAEK